MLYHIARWRMSLVKGLWNEELDRYVARGDRFTILFKRDRLFATHKQTPINVGGEDDQKVGARTLSLSLSLSLTLLIFSNSIQHNMTRSESRTPLKNRRPTWTC